MENDVRMHDGQEPGAPEDESVGVSSPEAEAEREHEVQVDPAGTQYQHEPDLGPQDDLPRDEAVTEHTGDFDVQPGTAGASHDVVSGIGPVPREDDSPDYPRE